MDELDDLEEFQDDTDDDDDYEDYEDDDSVEDEIPESSMEEEPEDDHVVSWDEIAAADDTAEETFRIKEWGGSVVVRGLTKFEFDDMRRKSRNPKVRGRRQEILEREIVIAGLVKPRIDQAKYNILQQKSAGVIVRILNKIMDKSGIENDNNAAKDRERRFPRKR
jgi:hypothetical protein